MGFWDYYRRLVAEFTHDWSNDVVQQLGLALVIAVGTLYFGVRLGAIALSEVGRDTAVTFLPLGVAGGVLFLLHLLRAPWRMYKTMRNDLQVEIQGLRNQVGSTNERIRKFESRLDPSFLVRVQNFSTGPAQADLGGITHDAIAHIELVVTNSGAPSIAADWRCEVRYGSHTFLGQFYAPPKGWKRTLADEAGKPIVQLSRDDFIIFGKSNTSPIATGERVIGWVAVTFAGISKDQLFEGSTLWRISFADSLNRRWGVEYQPGAGTPGIAYVPGGVEPIRDQGNPKP